ncbi:MAG: DUF1501 domain-containing protein [Planctomycetales bacterium]|nr:DUF1501 domain-containing protein [Planctomycetales bacterium]
MSRRIPRRTGCHTADHGGSRRNFLLGATAAAGFGSLLTPRHAAAMKRDQVQILQVFLQGGVSQFESWDPKPGTEFGGPFRAIPTSVPGTHICELLPYTAQKMHLLSLVRSINLKTNDHGVGTRFMEKGRKVGNFPYLGAVASRYLSPVDSPLPGFAHISTRGLVEDTAGFLEAQHAELKLLGFQPPANLAAPANVDGETQRRAESLRRQLNEQFGRGRARSLIDAYDTSFQQAGQLMDRRQMFERQSAKDLVRYGGHPFGRNCILARTLLEQGVTCVKVTHHGYDTHAENFNFHIEQLDEFDRTFATLLGDLEERGMLEHTLVIVFSEFGRTPKINVRYGRDHWGASFSIAMGGRGIQPGGVIGATNDNGTEVSDREVDAGHLFHTYLQAVGVDSAQDHQVEGRNIPIGDPTTEPIQELLA